MKLKYTEIKTQRQQALIAQAHTCALCGDIIQGDAVLDHDHKTGLIRKVLHRGCNALLGKVENNLKRNGMDMSRLARWSSKLVEYLTTHHTDLVHPTFLTPEERKMKAKAKRRGGTKRRGGK